LLGLLTVVIGASGTGIIVAISAVILSVVSVKIKPSKSIYLGIIFLVYALFIVFMDSLFNSELWIRFTEMLGKDSTLTSRTDLWEKSKELIGDNIIFGAGRGVEIHTVDRWGANSIIYEAHNFILEILLEGGIVALTVFGVLFFGIVKRLNLRIPKHRAVFIALCVVLINGLTESIVNVLFVTVLLGIAARFADENKGKSV
jgi:O-antigen ligase